MIGRRVLRQIHTPITVEDPTVKRALLLRCVVVSRHNGTELTLRHRNPLQRRCCTRKGSVRRLENHHLVWRIVESYVVGHGAWIVHNKAGRRQNRFRVGRTEREIGVL